MRPVSSALTLATALVVACGNAPPAPPTSPSATPKATLPPPPPPTANDAETDAAPAPKMSTADAAKVALPALLESLSQHDAKRYAGFFADDAVLTTPGAAPVTGRAAIAAASQQWFDTFSSLKVAASRVLVKGDMVAVEWAMTGTHSGDFRGVKPTEKPIGLSGLTLFFFDPDSGLVKEAHRYADDATILSQIGASKTKARAVPLLSTSAEWHVASGAADEAQGEALWKRALAAIGDKSESDYMAVHADDVAYDDLTQPLGLRGQSEARKWLAGFVAAYPDVKVEPAGVWGIEDYVVAEITIRGTQKASKKPVVLHAADVVLMKGGKVSHGWSYGDATELTAQLAPAPVKPPASNDCKKK